MNKKNVIQYKDADVKTCDESCVVFFNREQSLSKIKFKEKCLESLPHHHKKWLARYKEDLQSFKTCIEKNAQLIPLVLKHAHMIFGNFYAADEEQVEVNVLYTYAMIVRKLFVLRVKGYRKTAFKMCSNN